MDYCLESKTSNCKNCYKCIRTCPVKSISFTNNQATIIHDDCILCGQCYLACPQQVKIVRNDVEVVKQLIANHEKVIVSLAPSFIASYPNVGIESMRSAFQKLGFYDVEETAIGATIVKNAYNQMLDGKRDVLISSCCHSVNMLIEKYYPKALKYLADVLSPMLAHGKDLKTRYGKNTKIVFVGPCIAKKDEAERNQECVDAVLTFKELNEWLQQEKIVLNTIDDVTLEESKARFFPICGGIIKTMSPVNNTYKYVAVDGVEAVKKTLDDLINGKIHQCFIEMSACHGSCVNGPLANNHTSLVTNYLAIENAAGLKDFTQMQIDEFNISKTYHPYALSHATPSEEEITRTLKLMGKTDHESELNCGSCGYNSCREKAIAIIQGKAIPEMCLPFLMEKAQSFSDKIITTTPNGLMVLDESLNIQLINEAMCRIVGVSSPSMVIKKNITTILDPSEFARVLGENESKIRKKIYLSEYDKYVENTIVYDQKFHILICIMKDITNDEVRLQKRAEVLKKSIEITNEVIGKNMRTVQEIASLLGESAAETKVALLSLKDTLENE